MTQSRSPEAELFIHLRDNYYKNSYPSHDIGHQERMEDINKILANEGGQATVEATIKLIDKGIENSVNEIATLKTNHHADKKKHPVRTFFANDYAVQKYRLETFKDCLDNIKDELNSALRLKSVIDQSRPKKMV